MRRPTGYADLTRLKTFLAHSGQTAVLGVVAVLAMAAAPSATRSSVAAETKPGSPYISDASTLSMSDGVNTSSRPSPAAGSRRS